MSATEAVAVLLNDRRITRRRAAAARLRRLHDPATGPDVLEALEREVQCGDDLEATWQTLYFLVMALGEMGERSAIPMLRRLATSGDGETMVDVAVGDAWSASIKSTAPVWASTNVERSVTPAIRPDRQRREPLLGRPRSRSTAASCIG